MSSILLQRQYRFFYGMDPKSELAQRFLQFYPSAEIMFPNSYRFNKWTGQHVVTLPGDLTVPKDGDSELFCHEIAHCMELMRKGKAEKLLVNDFGWPSVQNRGWSNKMADNESLVFVFQWLLQDELGYNHKSGCLNEDMTAIFLEGMTDRRVNKQYFLELYTKLQEEFGMVWKDLFRETMDYIVAAVDAERISS